MEFGLIEVLCRICVLVELYHLFFYDAVMKRMKPILEIHRACNYLERMTSAGVNMSKLIDRNKYLQEALDVNHDELQEYYGGLNAKNIKDETVSKALTIYTKDNPNGLLKYLFMTFVEVIYWAALMLLAFNIPAIAGIILCLVAYIVSCISEKVFYSEKYGKYWGHFNIVDSTFFIILYMWIDYLY